VCISLCITVAHNTIQNSSDHLLSYPPDNHRCSHDVYYRVGGLHPGVSWRIMTGWGQWMIIPAWGHCFEFLSVLQHWWLGDRKDIRRWKTTCTYPQGFSFGTSQNLQSLWKRKPVRKLNMCVRGIFSPATCSQGVAQMQFRYWMRIVYGNKWTSNDAVEMCCEVWEAAPVHHQAHVHRAGATLLSVALHRETTWTLETCIAAHCSSWWPNKRVKAKKHQTTQNRTSCPSM